MTAITMDNKTDKNISSRNKKRAIFQKVLLVFNILLLIAAVIIAAMVLTGCGPKEPETFPEAEAMVASELESIKTADISKSALKEFAKIAEGDGEAYAEVYIEKLKDFDYEILGSRRPDGEEESDKAIVTVRINTYDFGSVYLQTWSEYIGEERDWLRSEHQFYTNLLTRILSMNGKEFMQDVELVCTDEGDGKWTCDIKGNETLMDAISGGLLLQMKALAEEQEKSE